MDIRKELEYLAKFDVHMSILESEILIQQRYSNLFEMAQDFCANENVKIFDARKDMLELIKRRDRMRIKIEGLSCIKQQNALKLHYFCDMYIDDVAEKMMLSKSRINQLIDAGIANITKSGLR